MDISKIMEIFERTKRNCLLYEKEGKKLALLNEIGCLRGVAYCLEEFGMCVHDDEFDRLIAIQVDLREQEV